MDKFLNGYTVPSHMMNQTDSALTPPFKDLAFRFREDWKDVNRTLNPSA